MSFLLKRGVVFLIGAFLLPFFIVPAYAHNGEVHELTASTGDLAVMQEIIKHLEEVIELYTQKATLLGVAVTAGMHADHADADDHADELKVWIELHSNLTHAHIVEPGGAEESFLLEDLVYTQEGEIIAQIVARTGLSEHDIEAVIEFPSGEVDEHGDSTDVEHGDDEDITGIHIMSDGTIMWGSGKAVEGATITVDGKVQLANGEVVEPKFDLR